MDTWSAGGGAGLRREERVDNVCAEGNIMEHHLLFGHVDIDLQGPGQADF